MGAWTLILGVAAIEAAALVFALALCRAAAEGDRRQRELRRLHGVVPIPPRTAARFGGRWPHRTVPRHDPRLN